MNYILPKRKMFIPDIDITLTELVEIIMALELEIPETIYENLPLECRRHFGEVK